jgi:hypothetical protein
VCADFGHVFAGKLDPSVACEAAGQTHCAHAPHTCNCVHDKQRRVLVVGAAAAANTGNLHTCLSAFRSVYIFTPSMTLEPGPRLRGRHWHVPAPCKREAHVVLRNDPWCIKTSGRVSAGWLARVHFTTVDCTGTHVLKRLSQHTEPARAALADVFYQPVEPFQIGGELWYEQGGQVTSGRAVGAATTALCGRSTAAGDIALAERAARRRLVEDHHETDAGGYALAVRMAVDSRHEHGGAARWQHLLRAPLRLWRVDAPTFETQDAAVQTTRGRLSRALAIVLALRVFIYVVRRRHARRAAAPARLASAVRRLAARGAWPTRLLARAWRSFWRRPGAPIPPPTGACTAIVTWQPPEPAPNRGGPGLWDTAFWARVQGLLEPQWRAARDAALHPYQFGFDARILMLDALPRAVLMPYRAMWAVVVAAAEALDGLNRAAAHELWAACPPWLLDRYLSARADASGARTGEEAAVVFARGILDHRTDSLDAVGYWFLRKFELVTDVMGEEIARAMFGWPFTAAAILIEGAAAGFGHRWLPSAAVHLLCQTAPHGVGIPLHVAYNIYATALRDVPAASIAATAGARGLALALLIGGVATWAAGAGADPERLASGVWAAAVEEGLKASLGPVAGALIVAAEIALSRDRRSRAAPTACHLACAALPPDLAFAVHALYNICADAFSVKRAMLSGVLEHPADLASLVARGLDAHVLIETCPADLGYTPAGGNHIDYELPEGAGACRRRETAWLYGPTAFRATRWVFASCWHSEACALDRRLGADTPYGRDPAGVVVAWR